MHFINKKILDWLRFLILGVVVQHFQSELIFLNKQKLCMASSVDLSDFLLPSGLALAVEELLG